MHGSNLVKMPYFISINKYIFPGSIRGYVFSYVLRVFILYQVVLLGSFIPNTLMLPTIYCTTGLSSADNILDGSLITGLILSLYHFSLRTYCNISNRLSQTI